MLTCYMRYEIFFYHFGISLFIILNVLMLISSDIFWRLDELIIRFLLFQYFFRAIYETFALI